MKGSEPEDRGEYVQLRLSGKLPVAHVEESKPEVVEEVKKSISKKK